MKKSFFKYLLIIPLVISIGSPSPAAEKIHAAVAANYIQVFRDLSAGFKKQTGIEVDATFSSSGSLYSQIANGAPYDIFLSADEDRPERLFREGLAEKPFIYATGQVVLWTSKKDLSGSGSWTEVVRTDKCKKLSIANPATAPYGLAAETALRRTGLFEVIRPKLVFSQDIAMAFQYATTGAVDAGFCSLSAASSDEGKKGFCYRISEAPEIVQSACILKRTGQSLSVQKFAAYLVSPEAAVIKTKYGYR